MTDERGDLDVLRSAEHDLCRVARVSRRGRAGQRQGCRGGVVEERKLGAGIVRKVAPVARQPQSGDRRVCKAALRCRVK